MRCTDTSCYKAFLRFTLGQTATSLQQVSLTHGIPAAAFAKSLPELSSVVSFRHSFATHSAISSSTSSQNTIPRSTCSNTSSPPSLVSILEQHSIPRQPSSCNTPPPTYQSNYTLYRHSILLPHHSSITRSHLNTHIGRNISQACFYTTQSRPGRPQVSSQQNRPASSQTQPLTNRKRSNVQQGAYNAHPPGSDRWNSWIKQLNLSGLPLDQASEALNATPTLLDKEPPPKCSENFRNLSAILMSECKVSHPQLREILMKRPEILMVGHLTGVVENLKWFKATFSLDTEDWMRMVFGCRVLIKLRSHELQERLSFYMGHGLEVAEIRVRWKQNPELLRLNVHAAQEKLGILQTLFGASGSEVVKSEPLVLLHTSKGLRERAIFLQQLNGSSKVSLADVQHASLDVDFAAAAVQAFMARSGKSLSQLWSELLQVQGVEDYMQKSKHDPNTLTEHRYFLVSAMFCRPNKEGR